MREYGILFSEPMILAVAAGRKTVTRRYGKQWSKLKPGDRLWTREAYKYEDFFFDGTRWTACVCYLADRKRGPYTNTVTEDTHCLGRPSIHQPRWAARCLLEVVSVGPAAAHPLDEAESLREGFASLAEAAAWLADYGRGRESDTLYRIEFRVVEGAQ